MVEQALQFFFFLKPLVNMQISQGKQVVSCDANLQFCSVLSQEIAKYHHEIIQRNSAVTLNRKKDYKKYRPIDNAVNKSVQRLTTNAKQFSNYSNKHH